MVDINKIMSGLGSSGLLGGLAGGAVAGGLMSKKGRKTAKTLLQVGGVAAVGTLAWKAYQDYQSNNSSASDVSAQPSNSHGLNTSPNHHATGVNNSSQQNLNAGEANNALPLEQTHFENLSTSNQDSLFVVKSMVAAAMSDGHIDGNEYQNIIQKTDDLGLSNEEKTLVFNEIKQPMSIEQLTAQVSSPQVALEVYTASLIAIDETRAEAKQYLSQLASGLQLPPPLVDSVHAQVG